MSFLKLPVTVFGFLLLTQIVNAGILGSAAGFSGLFLGEPSSATNMSALIAIGPQSTACFVVGACPQIAFFQGIDASAVWSVHIIDSNSPDFTGVVSLLTDGSPDEISAGLVPGPSYGTTSGGAVSFPEMDFGTSPDFFGHTIGSVSVRVDGVTIVDQPTGQFRLDYTVTVNSLDAPEPAAWMMLVGGAALLALRRKRVKSERARL